MATFGFQVFVMEAFSCFKAVPVICSFAVVSKSILASLAIYLLILLYFYTLLVVRLVSSKDFVWDNSYMSMSTKQKGCMNFMISKSEKSNWAPKGYCIVFTKYLFSVLCLWTEVGLGK